MCLFYRARFSDGWEDKIKNTLIYLIGFPATGKLTIAKSIVRKAGATLIDNHLINNPIFQIVRKSGGEAIPDAAWGKADEIRKIVFDTMVELAAREQNFVLTNQLVDHKGDRQLFDLVKTTANRREAKFVPVGIWCPKEVSLKRVSNQDREGNRKLTDPSRLEEIMNQWDELPVSHQNFIRLDTSTKSPDECANQIIEYAESC